MWQRKNIGIFHGFGTSITTRLWCRRGPSGPDRHGKYIYIYMVPPPPGPFPLVFSNSLGLQAFTNVYKHYGSIAVDLDPRSKIPGKSSWIWRQSFPRSETRICCGSKKFFWNLGSWIQTLDPRSSFWNLGSWIQINCYGSIVFINVCKRLETFQNCCTCTLAFVCLLTIAQPCMLTVCFPRFNDHPEVCSGSLWHGHQDVFWWQSFLEIWSRETSVWKS